MALSILLHPPTALWRREAQAASRGTFWVRMDGASSLRIYTVRLDLGGEWEGNTCPSRVQLSLGTNERDPPDAYKAPRAAGLFDRAAIRQWASTHREREGLPVSCPERAFAGRARTSPCAGAGVAARQ